jgi:hypothetical protein
MPLPSDDALDIYEDKRPPCRHALWGTGMRLEARVALTNLERGVVSLRSGYGRCSESAKGIWEKECSAAIPSTCTPSSWKAL